MSTSPYLRRSSRHHASTVAADAALCTAAEEKVEEEEEEEEEKPKLVSPTGSSHKKRKITSSTSPARKKHAESPRGKEKEKKTPKKQQHESKKDQPRRSASAETLPANGETGDENKEGEGETAGQNAINLLLAISERELTVKEVIAKRMNRFNYKVRGVSSNVAKKLREDDDLKHVGHHIIQAMTTEHDISDDDSLAAGADAVNTRDQLVRAEAAEKAGAGETEEDKASLEMSMLAVTKVHKNTKSNGLVIINGAQYIPMSMLIADDQILVPLNEPASLETSIGTVRISLAAALRANGYYVGRRRCNEYLLHVLRESGLVVHHGFIQLCDIPTRARVYTRVANGGGGSGRNTPSPQQQAAPLMDFSNPDHINRYIAQLQAASKENEASSDGDLTNATPPPPKTFGDGAAASRTLSEKILLIADFDAGLDEDQLADKYNLTCEEVWSVIRARVPIIREQARIMSIDRRKRLSQGVKGERVRRTTFVGLNIMMWRFFKDCRDHRITLTGKQLKEHAKTIANQLGLSNFKGSEGWLDAFKRRHKIDLKTMTGVPANYEEDEEGYVVCSGEPDADVDDETSSTPDENATASTANGDSPLIDGTTAALLAQIQATAMVSVANGTPLDLSAMEDSPAPYQMMFQNAVDQMALNGHAGLPMQTATLPAVPDETSLIAAIVKSAGTRVHDKEISHALETLRCFIMSRDPGLMTHFSELHTRVAALTSSPEEKPSPCETPMEDA